MCICSMYLPIRDSKLGSIFSSLFSSCIISRFVNSHSLATICFCLGCYLYCFVPSLYISLSLCVSIDFFVCAIFWPGITASVRICCVQRCRSHDELICAHQKFDFNRRCCCLFWLAFSHIQMGCIVCMGVVNSFLSFCVFFHWFFFLSCIGLTKAGTRFPSLYACIFLFSLFRNAFCVCVYTHRAKLT